MDFCANVAARSMTENKSRVGIIILAAGASSRLGQPKQLLKFEENTFICRVIESAKESKCNPIIVVLGANFEKINAEIGELDCQTVFNADWQTGMSSSIKTGLSKLIEIAPETSAVIISLCDQPLITKKHFNSLIRRFDETKKPVIAAAYNNTIGVPALFSKEIFSELLNLKGDSGAKQIIKKYSHLTKNILMPEGKTDIDTKEDFEKLVNK